MSLCTLANMPRYRLDPQRQQAQHAVVIISGFEGDVLLAETVELVTELEARKIDVALRTEMTLAMEVLAGDVGGCVSWNDDCSPMKARTCRSLGRSPTDDAVLPAQTPEMKRRRTA
jgi:hypothetical protein